VDYALLHAINTFVIGHPLLASAAGLLASWIVMAVAVGAIVPWLASGPGVDARKRATAGALAAAAVAMAANQILSHLWERARPFAAHPSGIVPIGAASTDPSFPSDHVAAATAIAVATWIAYPRAGRTLLVLAGVVAASRLLVGAHYPSDVLAGGAVGAISAVATMRLRRTWEPLVAIVARVTDPVRSRVAPGWDASSATAGPVPARCSSPGSSWAAGSPTACARTSSTRCRSHCSAPGRRRSSGRRCRPEGAVTSPPRADPGSADSAQPSGRRPRSSSSTERRGPGHSSTTSSRPTVRRRRRISSATMIASSS